MTVFSFETNLK